jgi:hypothetical protein
MIFISYAREDRAFAQRLHAAIDERLGLEVWSDHRLQAGDEFSLVIEAALERALVVVVLWSRDSVRSNYVIDEASRARDAGKLVPVRIDDIRPPPGFGVLHTLDALRGDSAADWDAREVVGELIHRIPRDIDLPFVLRLDARQSAELELARRLTRQRRVALVCSRGESLAGHIFATGLSLLGLEAIAAADLCVVMLFPPALGAWYFEACRRAAGDRLCYLVTGRMSMKQVRRQFPFLADEPDALFLTGRPLGVPLSGAGLAKTWQTLRFLLQRLQSLPPR